MLIKIQQVKEVKTEQQEPEMKQYTTILQDVCPHNNRFSGTEMILLTQKNIV